VPGFLLMRLHPSAGARASAWAVERFTADHRSFAIVASASCCVGRLYNVRRSILRGLCQLPVIAVLRAGGTKVA